MGNFKEKCKRGWTKTKEWFGRNKWTIAETLGLVSVTGTILGLGCYAYYKTEKDHFEKVKAIEDEMLNDMTKEYLSKGWDEEEYRENYEKVQEFAKTLNLKPGEAFYIEDTSDYYDSDWYKGPRDGTPVISHLVHGDGVYPPKEES